MRIIKVSEFFNTLNKTSLKVNVKDYDENKISVFIEDFLGCRFREKSFKF